MSHGAASVRRWSYVVLVLMTLTLALIAVASCAMGVQVAAARRVNIAGITTAFVTGTLTSLAESLMSRAPSGVAPRAVIVSALVAGALCSSLLLHLAPVWAGALPPVFMLLALVTVATRLRDLTWQRRRRLR
ncbi:uncharacterized membrane protein YoaK (UPF0700 family) [Streptosporangium album]|uniref:Uncharacterized membrane protein YoaK (UPF0700 family) n=1 Tax=Streptosporangium album TaxID=47479 RepID=A0A7W7WAM3_9ACTN|nr:DUF1275 family protein [Streptosporangium album]MBB4940587.1 uncharacterized membrane protein YoaK (UPF0700 family) [Streptosporangium album]